VKFSVWKLYTDYEKEEQWLNDMSAKGFHMVYYTPLRYVFEEGTPGKYTYRIELLDQLPSHPESRAYIRFMEEAGAEHVASILRWVYFRKPAADGTFEIYSDIDSRIRHHQKIALMLGVIGGVNVMIGLINMANFRINAPSVWRMPLGNIVLGMVILRQVWVHVNKMRKLKREKDVYQ
jgi:hypothetical protein